MTTMIDLRHDPDQLEVIDHGTGPLLVLGGPGTGKTTCLSERCVRLGRVDGPDRVLMLVPNRTQKLQVHEALTRRFLFDEGLAAVIEVPVYTWHGLAYHLVSRHYDDLGYPEPPVLLTGPEQWGDIKDALKSEDEANWPFHRHLLRNPGFVDEVVDLCIRAQQKMLDKRDLDALAAGRQGWDEVIRFYLAHRARQRNRSRIDYATLLAEAATLLAEAEYAEVRAALHQRFPHVLVDDAQELSLVQQRLLSFLAEPGEGRSLVVAGDPDSSIETFRGAEPQWLERFDVDFGAHQQVTLSTSYRLGPEVGARATGFISLAGAAPHRPKDFAGATILEVATYPSLAVESDAIVRRLRLAHLRDGIDYADMAILLTSPRSMLPALERAFTALQVPYSIAAPDRPLERERIVRAVCSLVRYALAPDPSAIETGEMLRSPLVGLMDEEVRALERTARLAGQDLDAVVKAPDGRVADEVANKIAELHRLVAVIKGSQGRPADETFYGLWQRSAAMQDLVARARTSLDDPANRDLDALVAFSRALGRFVERRHGSGTIEEYLEAIGRADFGSDPWLPPERRSGGVEVLSFHAAKGRQWKLVVVAGCVEGAIPKGRRAKGLFDPHVAEESVAERVRANEAEDRRVFYVAVTRASETCVVTASPGPSRKGRPSRFLEELYGEAPPQLGAAPDQPLTFAEAASSFRRVLFDPEATPGRRVAALVAAVETCRMDPSCTAADPSEWWWRWDWTEGSLPIRVQQQEPDSDLPLDKLRTSYSRIGEYQNCGLKYLLGTVLGLDPDTSHNMAFGSWVHKIFEEIETGAIQTRDQAIARYEQLFEDAAFPNLAMARQFRRDGEVMIDRYINQLDPGKARFVERAFSVHLDGHRITGRIDRVDVKGGSVIVSDYKTSRYAISIEDARKSLQLAIYHLALCNDPELQALGTPGKMELIYPRKLSWGKVTKRSQTPEEAEKVIAELPALMEGVLAEDFLPNPEADCMFCRFKPLCPLWPEGREVGT